MHRPSDLFVFRRLSRFLPLAACLTALLMPGSLRAGSPAIPVEKETLPIETQDPIFHRGALDLQWMSGVLLSVQHTSELRPNIDYAPIVLRLGYMADNVYGPGFLRGNDEFMLEVIGAAIFTGPGTGLGGGSLIYRRNFLSPNARVVPYFTAGVGAIYSDAFHDRHQRALGSPGEFDLQGALGLRFRVSTKLTLDTEFSYRHLSNAGLADRNNGTNAIGGMVGVSYGF